MVRNIEHTYHSNPEQINTEILREWLTGKGKQPVTWTTLIVTLEDIGLSALANDIRTITITSDDSSKPTSFQLQQQLRFTLHRFFKAVLCSFWKGLFYLFISYHDSNTLLNLNVYQTMHDLQQISRQLRGQSQRLL